MFRSTFIALSFALISSGAFAQEVMAPEQPQKPPQSEQQDNKKKEDFAWFNVVCYYINNENPDHLKFCKTAATFEKAVTPDGGEIADSSPDPWAQQGGQQGEQQGDQHGTSQQGNPWQSSQQSQVSSLIPKFEVECGQAVKWNDHARRFTGLLNTHIQALSGPHPSIYLPRGALHVGPHVAESVLEIDHKDQQLRFNGECHIWTGRP